MRLRADPGRDQGGGEDGGGERGSVADGAADPEEDEGERREQVAKASGPGRASTTKRTIGEARRAVRAPSRAAGRGTRRARAGKAPGASGTRARAPEIEAPARRAGRRRRGDVVAAAKPWCDCATIWRSQLGKGTFATRRRSRGGRTPACDLEAQLPQSATRNVSPNQAPPQSDGERDDGKDRSAQARSPAGASERGAITERRSTPACRSRVAERREDENGGHALNQASRVASEPWESVRGRNTTAWTTAPPAPAARAARRGRPARTGGRGARAPCADGSRGGSRRRIGLRGMLEAGRDLVELPRPRARGETPAGPRQDSRGGGSQRAARCRRAVEVSEVDQARSVRRRLRKQRRASRSRDEAGHGASTVREGEAPRQDRDVPRVPAVPGPGAPPPRGRGRGGVAGEPTSARPPRRPAPRSRPSAARPQS